MYFFPILFGFIGLWPVFGAIIFVSIDNRDDVCLYNFLKSQKSKTLRDHHVFVWPVVLWLWFKHLKEREL